MNIQPELSLREERKLFEEAMARSNFWGILGRWSMQPPGDACSALADEAENQLFDAWIAARPPQQGADEPAPSLVAAAERVLTVYGLDQTGFTERMDIAMENLHAALPKADAHDRMQWVSGPGHVAEFSNALCARGTYGCDSLHGQSGAPQTARSKSEYKRRVALGDPRVLPPAEPASEPAPEEPNYGELLCELNENEMLGYAQDSMEPGLLERWQAACEHYIESTAHSTTGKVTP